MCHRPPPRATCPPTVPKARRTTVHPLMRVIAPRLIRHAPLGLSILATRAPCFPRSSLDTLLRHARISLFIGPWLSLFRYILSLGAKGHLPSGYSVSSLWVL